MWLEFLLLLNKLHGNVQKKVITFNRHSSMKIFRSLSHKHTHTHEHTIFTQCKMRRTAVRNRARTRELEMRTKYERTRKVSKRKRLNNNHEAVGKPHQMQIYRMKERKKERKQQKSEFVMYITLKWMKVIRKSVCLWLKMQNGRSKYRCRAFWWKDRNIVHISAMFQILL